jgi:disulfide bond formation protein DsbB
MKTKILALATVLIALGTTSASAATRLMGMGCCPLCK